MSPLDLHVLSTPPAFVLSQDQTLSFNPVYILRFAPARLNSFGITVFSLRFCSVSFSRFSAVPAVSRASQLVYLIIIPKKSQQLFSEFFAFFCVFLILRTFSPKGFVFVSDNSPILGQFISQNSSSMGRRIFRRLFPFP